MAPDAHGRLAGKVALVTGGASGIGAAIVRRYAAEGAAVTIVDRDPAGAERCASDAATRDVDVDVEVGDVTADGLADAVVERVTKRRGVPDVLVNAAAIRVFSALLELEPELLDRHHRVNLAAPVRWTQAVARRLVDAGSPGSIVNVASVIAFRGFLRNGAYAASKAGLLGLARCAAMELAPHRIRVNAIVPGPTRTPLTAEVMDDEAALARLERAIPMSRVGEPDDMTGAAVFLASDESSYMTGATVSVDGGFLVA
jgi:NAD(P)-dependent dehydrogenase (short-subunit alcohol dehydrogenase family)